MRFRSLAMSALWMGIFVTTVMALRAADDKAKGNANNAIPPEPGTIKFTAAPKAVQNTYNLETKNSKIELLGESADGTFYMAIVGIGTNNYKFAIGKDGQVLEKVLQPIHSEIKDAEIPPAVQKALNEEAKGGKIDAVEKIMGGKRTDYIIDVVMPKAGYQLMFAEDGTLLSKMIFRPDEDPNAAKPKDKPADSKKKN